MKKIAAELLIERLIDWGVDTEFGLPGDGINGIMEALRRDRDQIGFVLVHLEEAAAFMATGYAKSTGRLGVCLATSGPGGIHCSMASTTPSSTTNRCCANWYARDPVIGHRDVQDQHELRCAKERECQIPAIRCELNDGHGSHLRS